MPKIVFVGVLDLGVAEQQNSFLKSSIAGFREAMPTRTAEGQRPHKPLHTHAPDLLLLLCAARRSLCAFRLHDFLLMFAGRWWRLHSADAGRYGSLRGTSGVAGPSRVCRGSGCVCLYVYVCRCVCSRVCACTNRLALSIACAATGFVDGIGIDGFVDGIGIDGCGSA